MADADVNCCLVDGINVEADDSIPGEVLWCSGSCRWWL